jgi:hypothetical protein
VRSIYNLHILASLLQFFKPENYFAVRDALIEAHREDLIGGCDGLIPALAAGCRPGIEVCKPAMKK